jgi:transcription termination factor Rho
MASAKVSVRVKSSKEENGEEKRSPSPSVIDLRTVSTPPPVESYAEPPPAREYPNGETEHHGRDVPTQRVQGILDIAGDGHGFLRPKFRPSDEDVYISASQIRKFQLRPGDDVGRLRNPSVISAS